MDWLCVATRLIRLVTLSSHSALHSGHRASALFKLARLELGQLVADTRRPVRAPFGAAVRYAPYTTPTRHCALRHCHWHCGTTAGRGTLRLLTPV